MSDARVISALLDKSWSFAPSTPVARVEVSPSETLLAQMALPVRSGVVIGSINWRNKPLWPSEYPERQLHSTTCAKGRVPYYRAYAYIVSLASRRH